MWGEWDEDEWYYDDWLALSKGTSSKTYSINTVKKGFAFGCSAGAVAAIGAFVVLKRGSKTDDFHRV